MSSSLTSALGGPLSVPAADSQHFSSRIQAHCRLIGLYRRKDEPLGQALLHRGALSSSTESSTKRRQCNRRAVSRNDRMN